MAARDPRRIRNVVVLGHRGTGKTSLVEALLYRAGRIDRQGEVIAGSTVCDWDELERRRGMSIAAALCHLEHDGIKINLIDTPGEPSFVADALSTLTAVDGAVLLVDAVAGLQVQTRRLWERAAALGVARLAVISMVDRERADFAAAAAQLAEFDLGCVPVQMTTGEGPDVGLVDLLVDGDVERERLIEAVAEHDDELLERYLEGEAITPAELRAVLASATRAGAITPVLASAATHGGLGAAELLAAIVDLLPSPVDATGREVEDADGNGQRLPVAPDGPAVAYCFKTMADQFSGKVNLLRVYSGTLTPDAHAHVSGRDGHERIGQLFTLQGKEHVALDAIGPGDIGAVAKLKHVSTGDVLSTDGHPAGMPAIDFPAPVMSFAIAPESQGDDDKMVVALRRLAEEDPTIHLDRDADTSDLLLGGLSRMHVETVAERARARFGVGIELSEPRVPYRETITSGARAEGKHKKQSGGRGQFGDCWVRVEPLAEGDFEFVSEIVGGAIPRQYIPAVERGAREAMAAGPLAGYPCVGVRVICYDGKHHSVDSSEMAFKIAGSLGTRAAIERAEPVLLEPIMLVAVTVPQAAVGDVMGDLNARRGHPLGMEATAAAETVHAEVPMAEMLSYAPDLRAMTSGEGDFTMEFLRYQRAPAAIAEQIIARSREPAAV